MNNCNNECPTRVRGCVCVRMCVRVCLRACVRASACACMRLSSLPVLQVACRVRGIHEEPGGWWGGHGWSSACQVGSAHVMRQPCSCAVTWSPDSLMNENLRHLCIAGDPCRSSSAVGPASMDHWGSQLGCTRKLYSILYWLCCALHPPLC